MMDCRNKRLRLLIPLILLSTLLGRPLLSSADDSWAIYDSDPQHSWNRVFRVLYDMTPPGPDSDLNKSLNTLWPESLVRGDRHLQVITTLDEFLNTRAERKVRDPVKRALFQNDLWKVFNWTLRGGTTDTENARVALQTRLVRVMRRVALTRDEISQLPDTYDSAIKSRAHPTAYDPENRQKTFLPPDLWIEKGSWVLLGNNSQRKPAAILHSQQLGTTSDFLVLLSLAGGPEQTRRWLEQLTVLQFFQSQYRLNSLKRQGLLPASIPLSPPIEEKTLETWLLSVIRPGTRLALVRQMRVIDAGGYDAPTRIIERVQIRVYRDPKLPPQYPPAPASTQFQTTQPIAEQDVFMLSLDRRALVRGQANSLRPVGLQEYTVNANFINGIPLPEEIRPIDSQPGPRNYALRVLDSCAMCHSPPGLFSFMTFSRAFTVGEPMPDLHAQKREHEEGKGRQLNARALGYLQALWNTVPD